jgi:NitT/TauT family transport system permease protein
MKRLTVKLFTPYEKLTPLQGRVATFVLVVVLLLLWSVSGHEYIPTPMEIVNSFPRLFEGKDLHYHFQKSLMFCFKAILYAVGISLVFCYLSVIPFFSKFCEFSRKFRLPSTGFSFLFMKIGGEVNNQMTLMMVFGICVWLIDSTIKVALDTTEDDINYAKSLRLNGWQRMRELLILGKAADIFSCIISNFAIAWMLLAAIENIAKASGGIGVVLAESNKYYKFGEVYAIQILILVTGILVDWGMRGIRSFMWPYTAIKR